MVRMHADGREKIIVSLGKRQYLGKPAKLTLMHRACVTPFARISCRTSSICVEFRKSRWQCESTNPSGLVFSLTADRPAADTAAGVLNNSFALSGCRRAPGLRQPAQISGDIRASQ